jgi:hypothetical protein
VVAANASGRLSWCPPSGVTWYLEEMTFLPNETSTAHATDYADITVEVAASTAIAATRSTNSGTGSTMTQNTAETIALTGTKAQRAITQANPLHVDIDATPGAGVAVDLTAIPTFSVKRV